MTTGTYLDKILPQTRDDLDVRIAAQPLKEVRSRVRDLEEARDFIGALSEDRLHLIAEVKRASPSKGDLAPDIDAADLARIYIENGASAISVLTDTPFFKGSLDDLKAVRGCVGGICARQSSARTSLLTSTKSMRRGCGARTPFCCSLSASQTHSLRTIRGWQMSLAWRRS